MAELAIFGGEPAFESTKHDLFEWPRLGPEEEAAVLRLMRERDFFNDTEVPAFEREFADWLGVEYALTESSGTHAVLGALYACGVGRGDEVIVPASTYWASAVPILSLKASPVFADIDPDTLNISVDDFARKITDRTRAVVVVHLLGYPADMDRILDIAHRHGIYVVEDASHAHGSLYHGQKVGPIGDVGAFSLCGKPLSIGEGGILVTRDRDLWERAVSWGHNFRFNRHEVTNEDLLTYAGLPMGGVTSRMHNLSAAIGRVQLRHYDERAQEIDQAMNYFWDCMKDVPGIKAHRPPRGSGSTMGGWYNPHGIYQAHELGGLSAARFAEAVRAEGVECWTRKCIKDPLHKHPLFHTADVYGDGKPTVIAHSDRDVRQSYRELPVAESVRAFTVPGFKKFDKAEVERYVEVYEKVTSAYQRLIPGDQGDDAVIPDERGDG